MERDTREDEGQFYPNGKVVPRGRVNPIIGGGDMSRADFTTLPAADLVPDQVGLPEICETLNQIKVLLRPIATAIAILLSFAALAGVETKTLTQLKGSNTVVTAVSLNAADVGALPDTYRAPVSSVNSKTGAVALVAEDIPLVGPRFGYYNNVQSWVNMADSFLGTVPSPSDILIRESMTGRLGLYSQGFSALDSLYIGGTDEPHKAAVLGDIPTDAHITDLANAAASSKADAATVAALAQNVEVWTGVWKGDNSRVVITNYDSQVHLPEFSFEQRTNEVDMATNLFRVVWREMAHWESFLGLGWDWEDPNWQGFGAWKSSTEQAIAGKADRAWGYYDSHSGNYAPDGYTWISSPNIAIAGGLAYNKVLTSEGAVWVLESNGLVTETSGTESNGFFRISDDAGNSLFEIVKGDKRTVGATAGTVQQLAGFAITHLQVGYNVQSEEHPKIYVTDSLKPANWKAEDDPDCVANVEWSGSSGAWIATVSGKVAMPAFFVQASYEVGGNTYIKQSAPVQMSKIVLGGVEYTLGTAVINGNTVLTLTP